jgi:S-adenosylmethionine synthetase
MSNENVIYNPYYGDNLCNLLANSIVEKIKSVDPKLYVNISVTNVNSFFMTCGETEYSEPLDITEIFNSVMETVPEPLKLIVKVFDLISYNTKRVSNTILYSEQFSKYKKTLSENFTKYSEILKLNKKECYTNIKCFNTDVYVETLSNINEVKLPKDYIDWKPNTKVFTSSPMFGKDLYSEKYIYMLFRYIAHTLFEAGLCNIVKLSVNTNNPVDQLYWDNVNFEIDSEYFLSSQKWTKSLVLDIFNFEVNKVIEDLNLEAYDFANEIIHENENYPWLKNDKLNDIVLV